MKILKNHLILFDAECPMCKSYTKVFVNVGLLDQNSRRAYQDIETNECPLIDMQRAVNEIALVNRATGEVTYGIDSLFKIFATAWPVFKPLFAWTPFVWLMSKIYAFISYNRRVIIPATGTFTFQPAFRLKYRLAYLLFTFALTVYILTGYAALLQGVLPVGQLYREFLICGGQIIFQGCIISMLDNSKKWEYLGNMMTISFAGSLLLLPALLLSAWLGHAPLFYTEYFMLVAVLMFLEHIRRSKILQIGWTLTISWAFYRAMVLIMIILFNKP